MGAVRELLAQYTWDLALGVYDKDIIRRGVDFERVRIVSNPYRKKWFADPFILSEDDRSIQLLVEEFDSDVKRGRIARLEISKADYEIKECAIILEADTHLSFPAIYRLDSEVFVHPENSASGKSIIYRYDVSADKLVEPKVLVEKPLVDAVIQQQGGKYIMYATPLEGRGGPLLHTFRSDSLLGPYEEAAAIDFGRKTARMAGAMIVTPEGPIRPAQDCTRDYGEAVLFYKDKDIIGEIRPAKYGRYAGVHTFNSLSGSFVIDLKKYKYALVRNAFKRILGKD